MKKLLKIIGAAFVLFTCSAVTVAADPMDYKNSLGMYVMAATDSMGLQYQTWINNKVGLQVQGYATYRNNSFTEIDTYDCSISTQLLWNLFENPISEKTAINFYAWGLVGYRGYNTIAYIGEADDVHASDTGILSQAAVGLGFGFEFMFLRHLSIPLEFGYAGRFINNTWMGFTVGSGLRYRF